jgi:hypothetical protein
MLRDACKIAIWNDQSRYKATMTPRALPEGLAHDLQLFEERVSELLLHPLVKEGATRAPHHLAIVFIRAAAYPFRTRRLSHQLKNVLSDLLCRYP